MKPFPVLGVAIVLRRGDTVLVGRRKNGYGDGMWALPGGHVEAGESIEAAARREALEETGLHVETVHIAWAHTEQGRVVPTEVVNLYVIADCPAGEAINAEPDRCYGWEWLQWNAIPEPRFYSLQIAMDRGFDPFVYKK